MASPTPTPTATVQPTATPREQPTPLATLLDPPPTNCPLSPPLQTLSFAQFGGFTRGVTLYGAPPAWMADFDPAPVLHLEEPLGYRPYPGEKIIWEVGPNYTLSQPVTAQVTNLETGALAWWDTGTGNGPTPYTSHTLVLDQSQPSYHGNSGTPSEPNWQEWGSGLYILQAGCYSLVVRWPGGQWQTNFAAGR